MRNAEENRKACSVMIRPEMTHDEMFISWRERELFTVLQEMFSEIVEHSPIHF